MIHKLLLSRINMNVKQSRENMSQLLTSYERRKISTAFTLYRGQCTFKGASENRDRGEWGMNGIVEIKLQCGSGGFGSSDVHLCSHPTGTYFDLILLPYIGLFLTSLFVCFWVKDLLLSCWINAKLINKSTRMFQVS